MADVYHVLVFPCEISHLPDVRSSIHQGFCCQYLHDRPFSLAQLCLRSCTDPCDLNLLFPSGSSPAAERRGLKKSWRKGVWRWLLCGHPVFTSLLALWVSSLLVWLWELKSYLPPARLHIHPAFLGRSSSSQHTKGMLKLPLQLTEEGIHFSRGTKICLQLSIGSEEEPELFL